VPEMPHAAAPPVRVETEMPAAGIRSCPMAWQLRPLIIWSQKSLSSTLHAAHLGDALMHPDGGFPTLTDGLPAANPGNTLRIQLKVNDQRNWAPTAPTLLCAGDSDPRRPSVSPRGSLRRKAANRRCWRHTMPPSFRRSV